MPKIRKYLAVTPQIESEPLGISPGVLARRVFTKRLYQWCPIRNIEFDPWCDFEYPKTITYNEIAKAKSTIKHEISCTPLTISKHNRHFLMDVYYKLETFHPTGSFKERGALFALKKLSPEQRTFGVITASLGNWAMALAYWGQKLETHVTVVLPDTVPKRSHKVCHDLGATVLVYGTNLNEAKRKAFTIQANTKLNYINGYDHPHVIAAAGTIGIEILEQLPETQAILVPVGGGSLLAGIATAVKHINPQVLVYGIESNKCPSFTRALENNIPTQTALECSIATSLDVPIVGCNALQTARDVIDDVVRIQDDYIIKALAHLIDKEKLVVEGAGAIAVAALMALPRPLKILQEKKVVCIISGGNLEPILFHSLERVKVIEGRLFTIKALLLKEDTDTYQKILDLIANMGCNIIKQDVEQSWQEEQYINYINVLINCEAYDQKQAEKVTKIIQNMFPNICEVLLESTCTSNMCKCYYCKK